MTCILPNLIYLAASIINIAIFWNTTFVSANGRLLEPASRSSLWRNPEYKDPNPPVNYNDNHLDCGGALVPEVETGFCGVCGDPISDHTPRPNEDGGSFSKGIIARRYKSGQDIPVTVQLTYGQKGYFDFTLCARNDPKSHVDPDCYKENLLKTYPITDNAGKYYNLTLTLPLNVSCSNCVLRWRYRTGNNWGECGDGKAGALGCGPQQAFHGCSDIEIL